MSCSKDDAVDAIKALIKQQEESIALFEESVSKSISRLKERLSELSEDKPHVIDKSYIGHVVEVRDSDNQDWVITVLRDIWDDEPCPFRGCICGWEQCRPRQDGISGGRWIKHDGGKCPVGNYEFVVVVCNDGTKSCDSANEYRWDCIVKYAVIKVG